MDRNRKVEHVEGWIIWHGTEAGFSASILHRLDFPHKSYDAGNARWLARPYEVGSFRLWNDEGQDILVLAGEAPEVKALILKAWLRDREETEEMLAALADRLMESGVVA